MKKQINDLLLKMQNGENCIGETANQLLDLFAVSGSLLSDDYIRKIADEYANQFYSKDANPISHESLTEPFIDGFKKAMEFFSNDR
jgi:hypothetical protein